MNLVGEVKRLYAEGFSKAEIAIKLTLTIHNVNDALNQPDAPFSIRLTDREIDTQIALVFKQ